MGLRLTVTSAHSYMPSPRPRFGRHDPILQELWAVKAAMNAEAGYNIGTFFDL
ncbi:hypothetical protein Cenrod_0600 [Candidatus Symbiobacter mobilis CR]|uniref:Uncharacterized protein n=1 Tax=Candidatus Symbiobacter mobilis CR TaxID=946483 RepID=U5N5B5_9BURK|nr:hypothetical protein Cenrod_0600 [Candidatus Symbiobacter mobilis CR]